MTDNKRPPILGSTKEENSIPYRSTRTEHSLIPSRAHDNLIDLQKAIEDAKAGIASTKEVVELLSEIEPTRIQEPAEDRAGKEPPVGKSQPANQTGRRESTFSKSTLPGFGQYIRKERKRIRASQEQMAGWIGRGQSWYSDLELGRIEKPDFRSLASLAAAFDLPLEDFFDRSPFQQLYRAGRQRMKAAFCPNPACWKLKAEKRPGSLRILPHYEDLSKVDRLLCPDCGEKLISACRACNRPIDAIDERFCNCGFFHFSIIIERTAELGSGDPMESIDETSVALRILSNESTGEEESKTTNAAY